MTNSHGMGQPGAVNYELTHYPIAECPECEGGNLVGASACRICFGTRWVKPVRPVRHSAEGPR